MKAWPIPQLPAWELWVLLGLVACSSGAISDTDAGSPTSLSFFQSLDTVPEGQPLPLFKVTVWDATHRTVPVSGRSITITVESGSGPGSAVGTTSALTQAGLASFSDVRITQPGLSYKLRASSPGLSDAVSAPFAVTVAFAFLRAGFIDSCGVNQAQRLYCWGGNAGELTGTGSGISRLPRLLLGPWRFEELAVGPAQVCGVVVASGTFCWGPQMGLPEPQPLPGSPAFVRLGLSRHGCGLLANGTALCWGDNESGQLGRGSIGAAQPVPQPVAGSHTFQDIAVGSAHTCALEGTVGYCWGNNGHGELGNGGGAPSTVPVTVSGGLQFSRIFAGLDFSCGISVGGAAYCWGGNDFLRLGSGTAVTESAVPLPVAGGISFTALSLGFWHVCGLSVSGDVYCWGRNLYGQVGTGSALSTGVPIKLLRIHGNVGFDLVVTGANHSCARTTSGLVYCWGANDFGQLGNGMISSGPVPTLVLPP